MRLDVEMLDRRDLTPREADVLRLVCAGLSDKSIASALGISIKTVATHIDHVYEKLDLKWSSVNARCTAIGLAVATKMVRVGVQSLCVFLVCHVAILSQDSTRPRDRPGRTGRVSSMIQVRRDV